MDVQKMCSSVAQEIHQLPIARIKDVPALEREEALSELHCIVEPIIEEPGMVLAALEELDRQLDIWSIDSYQEAVRQSETHVNSWKLRFLRAERWHADRAAMRMMRHYALKEQFFGKECLGRDLQKSDLTKDELAALQTGVVQVLSQRDCGGRTISVEMGIWDQPIPIHTKLKLQFWLAAVASEDIASQQRGVVAIHYGLGRSQYYPERASDTFAIWAALPLRLAAIHCFYDDPHYATAMTRAAESSLDSNFLCRLRCHWVSDQAGCERNLALFGIPSKSLPLHSDGSVDCGDHYRWLQQQQCQRQYQWLGRVPQIPSAGGSTEGDELVDMAELHDLWDSPLDITTPPMIVGAATSKNNLEPTDRDVIMGRGRRKHPGNQRLWKLVQEHLEYYDTEQWARKRSLCEELYDQMEDSGCLFLEVKGQVWQTVPRTMAVKKIGHVFRDLRRQRRRGQPE